MQLVTVSSQSKDGGRDTTTLVTNGVSITGFANRYGDWYAITGMENQMPTSMPSPFGALVHAVVNETRADRLFMSPLV
ncbi:hypothetical protein PR202_ga30346 [Eleusine coracana subsp. coracana]|uniref:Dirigent protein n=1 Tax=Eleusine coracana subsp. coracana TaxID=191504 RepID=A0AAV5DN71_ELECO|nr:hypothetical protein PR202_ga30346 [Eleusine coracana subsp. coracana]